LTHALAIVADCHLPFTRSLLSLALVTNYHLPSTIHSLAIVADYRL